MKTLQQEIVEAIKLGVDAHVRLNGEDCRAEYMLHLAAKVESARCKNCVHYEYKDNELSNFCKFLMCVMSNNDGCWHFEPKEK